GTTSYHYDQLNRLTVVQAPTGPVTYTYDAAGNRTVLTGPASTLTYTYDVANELLTAGSTRYAYDADGNRVSATPGVSTTTYTYDDANYMTGLTSVIQSASYRFNGDHVRVGSTVNGTATADVLDLASALPTVV